MRTVKNAVTPQPIKQVSRTAYVVTHPIGAAENKIIDVALGSGGRRTVGAGRRPSSGVRPRSASRGTVGNGVRAAEATASLEELARLMSVGHQQFAEAQRPLVPEPAPVDATPFREKEWARRKTEAHWWQRRRRRQIRKEARDYGERQAADTYAVAQQGQQERQSAANAEWDALCRGERSAITTALLEAFQDSPSPVQVVDACGSAGTIAVLLPGPHVLPEKMPHTTPTGRLSAKAWPKPDFNEAYAGLLGAHLLAASRRAWAAVPSLSQLRVIGLRETPDARREVLFDVEVRRAAAWNNDGWGASVLEQAERGLNRVGKSREVRAWAQSDLAADIPLMLRPSKRDLHARLHQSFDAAKERLRASLYIEIDESTVPSEDSAAAPQAQQIERGAVRNQGESGQGR
ncbi:hypothetical protein ACIRVK_01985 [Streptomyces sp. NPDC101152]|uniref:hypothetical protein n=1 Tax=Streptomyces sp. NPDC101152 TaxID=3366116 RepID=UPI0037F6F5A6